MISALVLAAALTLQPPAEAATPAPAPATAPAATPEAEVGQVLDQLHTLASQADGDAYFALFTPDARFLGTDATERWSLDAFRAYALPYFNQGRGWTYEVIERDIAVSPTGDVAWFDERLTNAGYGETRGSGVLVRTEGGWKIAQYVLSFAVPNEVADDVVARIREGAEVDEAD